MFKINKIHHIAIICSNYERSKDFYTRILRLNILQEVYREERKSFKLDLALNDQYILEIFSFPDPPKRLSRPEGTGLRHLAFEVEDINAAVAYLINSKIEVEPIRTDEYTGRRFTFFADPDDLPIEFYEN
jgi:glyoxylase I family protein